MLEASRAEIDEFVPEFLVGPNKTILRKIWLFMDNWVIEPMFTGFRFLHLVIIFVPVIIAIPAIWLGSKDPKRDNERSGTLWWYGFLVGSMERAGAAFIKVCSNTISMYLIPLTKSTAWTMGGIAVRHFPSRDV